MKICLVEDNEDLRDIWTLVFGDHGHECKVYADGNSLLMDHSSVREADLVITDYHLPDMNGIDLVQIIQETYPDKTFFFFTGSSKDEVRNTIKQMKNCHLFIKPVDLSIIEKALAQVPHSP